jgi:uncharacterized protein (TIGR00375 family)
MRQILDLHIHSKYSRACSPRLNLTEIEAACRRKGIDIVATGDFTHPAWLNSIKKELAEIDSTGLYYLKSAPDKRIKFILQSEVALIYKDAGKTRKIHLIILAPNLEAAVKLQKILDKNYNVRSDGRPILGISAPNFVRLCLNIDPHFLIYPAHIWTPWFGVLGSKSGFDSFTECFGAETKNIYAYETGLSSDPEMNWRLSALDNLTCLSSSDAHSPENLGREANIFDLKNISYSEIYRIIKEKDITRQKLTLEFYPEEGMYFFDGHRDCNFSCDPEIALKKYKNICPKCQRELTLGVLHRVAELADRPRGFKPKNAVPFKKIISLEKIIATKLNIKNPKSASVQKIYKHLIENYGPELQILLDLDLEKISLTPGFDGQYGTWRFF